MAGSRRCAPARWPKSMKGSAARCAGTASPTRRSMTAALCCSGAAAPARLGSRPVLSGRRSRLMPGALQDYVAQPGFVFLTERRQDHGLGQLRANEALAFERRPDRWVAQAGRIARRDDRLAEMEMIAMRI